MAYEDFTTFTESDPESDITVGANLVSVDTMRRAVQAYLIKDYGAGYFDQFTIEFEAGVSGASGGGAELLVFGVSLNAGSRTWVERDTNNDGVCFWLIRSQADDHYYAYLFCHENNNYNLHDFGLSPPGTVYITVERSGSSTTVRIYSDEARTALIDILTVTDGGGTWRYLCAVASTEEPTYNVTITGHVANYEMLLPVAVEDASLDLGAYYQAVGDLASFLTAHDGTEYRDLGTFFNAIGWNIGFGDRWGAGDLWDHWSRWGYFPVPPPYDLAALLEALAEKREDLAALMQACGFRLADMGALLEATDGVVFKDFGVYLQATDGTVFSDAQMWLRVIANIPTFRMITAQKVSSVIHEVGA